MTEAPTVEPVRPDNQGGPWTEPRVDLLLQLHADGWSCSQIALQIATELGVKITRNAVIGKIHRMGLHGVPRPPNPAPLKSGPRRKGPQSGTAKLARKLRFDFRAPRKPRSRVPIPLASLPIPEPSSESALTFAQLPHGPACRWIIGDPKGFDTLFCGADPVTELPYCPHHARRAYVCRSC